MVRIKIIFSQPQNFNLTYTDLGKNKDNGENPLNTILLKIVNYDLRTMASPLEKNKMTKITAILQ